MTIFLAGCTTGEDMGKTLVLETNKGNIQIQLNASAAPLTVANIKAYVSEGFYDGTVFHRVIKDFMIQGGGFTADGIQKETKDPVVLEADNGLKNVVGAVAMARTNDPNSATSQFFINTKDNEFLNSGFRDAGYTVFGKVINGMEVVREIELSPTGTKQATVEGGITVPMNDWPINDIIITKAYIK